MMPLSCRFRFLAIVFFALSSLSVASSKLSVSPVNPRLLKNSPLRFTALLNGEVADGPIRWSSSNPAVATINSSGSATLLAAGTTTVTAVHGGQKASTVLTVTVAVSPIFTAQPTNTDVSAVIDSGTGMKVQLLDNLGGPLPGQNIAVSIGTNPPGTGTLSGTLTQATDATGTATDALCVLCPDEGRAHSFGGPRSVWGARLARAVHAAVMAGARAPQ